MAVPNIPWVSPDEYLDQEAVSETKHEYYKGVVTPLHGVGRPVAGWSVAHGTLKVNLLAAVHGGVRGRGWRVFGGDVRFQSGYPDLMVIGGPIECAEGTLDVVCNPNFTAEIVSPATEAHDRREKSREYRATPSLREYAMISQVEPWVEIHTRDESGRWWISEVTGLDGVCEFRAINCVVPMAALYEGVLDS